MYDGNTIKVMHLRPFASKHALCDESLLVSSFVDTESFRPSSLNIVAYLAYPEHDISCQRCKELAVLYQIKDSGL